MTDTTSPQTALQPEHIVTYLNVTNFEQTLAIETDYGDSNSWIEWVRDSAQQFSKVECIACTVPRPILGTALFRLNLYNDEEGYNCILSLFATSSLPSSRTCQPFHYFYSPVSPKVRPPNFTPYAGNYTCIKRSPTRGIRVGAISTNSCNITLKVNES